MGWDDDDYGGLDDLFVPRDPDTGDPVPDWTAPRAPRRPKWHWWSRRRGAEG